MAWWSGPQLSGRRDAKGAFAALAIIVVALNLRPPIAAIGQVLYRIETAAGLTSAGAGLLTTLPVLLMGVGSRHGAASPTTGGATRRGPRNRHHRVGLPDAPALPVEHGPYGQRGGGWSRNRHHPGVDAEHHQTSLPG